MTHVAVETRLDRLQYLVPVGAARYVKIFEMESGDRQTAWKISVRWKEFRMHCTTALLC